MKNYKELCADCACLIEKKGVWCCDECFGQKCEDLDYCPEGMTLEEVTEAQDKKAPKLVARSDEKKERKPRERKPNEDKRFLINLLWSVLKGVDASGCILNPEREITFDHNGKNYSVVLTEHRPKKK